MSEKKSATGPTFSELERLRDILYGEYARDASVRMDDLEAHLAQFRLEVLKNLQDQDSGQANQLEVTRQELIDKIDALSTSLHKRMDDLEADMLRRFAAMDDQKANRRDLGQMLVAMGQQLQAEEGES